MKNAGSEKLGAGAEEELVDLIEAGGKGKRRCFMI
jgi:hypothetical protein